MMTVQRASKTARKTPQLMQRLRHPWKKLKLWTNQSIIILWFAISLRYFSKTQRQREPYTYVLIVSTYSTIRKRATKTHLIDCKIHKPQVIELPDPDDVKKNSVSFRNVFKSFPVQFCLYVDFECFLGKSDGSRKNVQQIHEVSGFCMLRVSTEPTLNNCKPYSVQRRKRDGGVL